MSEEQKDTRRQSRLAAVVLAAGQGTRMKSHLPKVLHKVAGLPMLQHVLAAVDEAGAGQCVVVVGHGAQQVREALPEGTDNALQAKQQGTGHAVLQARAVVDREVAELLVVCGDTPLLTGETLRRLVGQHRESGNTLTLLTAELDRPFGYGRVVRDEAGRMQRITEEVELSEAQRAIREVNTGVYCLRAGWLWPALEKLPLSSKQEYYLTDLVAMAVSAGEPVGTLKLEDAAEMLGVNDRVQLATAEGIMRRRILERLMRSGVTVHDPASTFVEASVRVGEDSELLPFTHLQGTTVVGNDCRIGPHSLLRDSEVGDGCHILASVLEQCKVEANVRMGPYCHLRPGAHLASEVELGNYAEVKNSYIGSGSRMHHFSYIGDATLGRNVNIGAGTITCNYDSETGEKNRTVVEDNVGLGSDTMLVAPVHLGEGATTGAGSVVTKDLPAGAVAFGVPAVVRRRRRPVTEDEGGC